MAFTVSEIAREIEGAVVGDATLELKGFALAETAGAGDLTFAENEAYFVRAEKSAASAILVSEDFSSHTKTLIRVANARVAFAKVLQLFFPERKLAPGIHPSAIVAASACVDATAHVGPFCVIGERTVLGPRVVLEGGDHVGDDCALGDDTRLLAQVTIYARSRIGQRVRLHSGVVIGSDGFGYVFDQGQHRKVQQIGNVVLHDDVEIGANTVIDRGALGSTVIGRGTKIDNLVQIGHNVVIGEHCILCGQVGIAGSTTIGNYVTVAGQVGIAGHLKIGDRATIGAQSGVMHDIPAGEKWFGYPAQRDRRSKRAFLSLQRMPEMLQRLGELEKALKR